MGSFNFDSLKDEGRPTLAARNRAEAVVRMLRLCGGGRRLCRALIVEGAAFVGFKLLELPIQT